MLTFAISHRTLLLARQKESSPPNKPTVGIYEVPSSASVAFWGSSGSYGGRGKAQKKDRYISKQENIRYRQEPKIKQEAVRESGGWGVTSDCTDWGGLPKEGKFKLNSAFQNIRSFFFFNFEGRWSICETRPSVLSLRPWENVSFGRYPSVLFEMFLLWPHIAGVGWEKFNPSFLLSSRLRNVLAHFLP